MDIGADNSNYVFMVGQSTFNEQAAEKSYAIITCIDLAYHLTPIAELKLPNIRYLGATSLKRLRPTTNEFVVGVFRSIVIMEFIQGVFIELMVFENLHTCRHSLTKQSSTTWRYSTTTSFLSEGKTSTSTA